MNQLNEKLICEFKSHLISEEKTEATVDKYTRDIQAFFAFVKGREFKKQDAMNFRAFIASSHTSTSVNTVLSSLNAYFRFIGSGIRMKYLKHQRAIFSSAERELTKAEYERLLTAAQTKKNERLYLLMQTICSTGIRVSELKFITAEAVRDEYTDVYNKGKERRIYLPRDLCKMLKAYCKQKKISSGPVFVTRNGNPLDRSNIWSDMKSLCKSANVSEKKVFPHNLRHLFARTYYSIQKDIVRLADILGHSSINTTRIYTMESGEVHRRQIQKLGLLSFY